MNKKGNNEKPKDLALGTKKINEKVTVIYATNFNCINKDPFN